MYISFWHGLWAPKGTPKDVVAKLNAAVVDSLGRSGRAASGSPSSAMGSRSARNRPRRRSTLIHKAEIDKWWPIIKAANIKLQ